MHKFDYDYYERGEELGISGYTNYHWLPEMTIPMAKHLVQYLDINKTSRVLDFGCAKGYVVKSLLHLGYDAWGADVSEYAISHADADTKSRLQTLRGPSDVSTFAASKQLFTHVIAKDVLEHIPYEELSGWIRAFHESLIPGGKLYVLVPLATAGRYRVPAYERDVTHIIREDETWWREQVTSQGFVVSLESHHLPGIKDNWRQWKDGNLQCIFTKM